MKYIGNIRFRARGIMAVLPALAVLSLASCQEEEPMKSVDLRYLAEDSYSLTASDAEPITLYVSSTDPWTVFSQHPDWCTISPSEGEAGVLSEPTEVTVTYNDNTGLDDRIDTLIIQSDYWIGKWVQVIQKGTAYMEFDTPEVSLTQEGGTTSVSLSTNHRWTATVTAGAEWLTLEGAVTGDGDGSVTFTAEPNKGEVRTGIISILDHNDVECAVITVTQEGVQLDPSVTLIKTDWKAKEYVIHVESNSEWTVTKDDPDVAWYSFPQSSFTGTQDLVVSILESPTNTVRTATFTISSVSEDESVIPVSKQITIKQSYQFLPDMIEFTQSEIDATWMVWGYGYSSNGDDLIMTSGARSESRFREIGYHTFKIKSMDSDAAFRLELLYNGGAYDVMFRWGADATTGMTFTEQGSNSNLVGVVPFDYSQPNEFSYYFAPNDENFMYVEYMLNGDIVGTYTFDGSDGGTVIPYPLEGQITILIGATAGAAEDAVVFDSWGHCPVIDWGD